jgi:phosphoserine phosphatase
MTTPSSKAEATTDPLPSWNEGPAKAAVLNFVKAAIDETSPNFARVEDRIATFDQDGTLWVEQPLPTQMIFALHRVSELAADHPEWKNEEPFKSIIAGDKAAMSKFTMKDLEAIVFATHAGMTAENFHQLASTWITTAKDGRWNRPYTELVFQPMLEVMQYLRANGFAIYIVTGGGQAFVRAFSEGTYDIPIQRIVGSAGKTEYTYDKDGRGVIMKLPTLLFFNDVSAKPEDINLFVGRRPLAAFGNSTGDKPMLEYAEGNVGQPLMMLVLHDDAQREYAYGPATGLPSSPLSVFSQELYDEAKSKGWSVISMKNDWKRIFAFDP